MTSFTAAADLCFSFGHLLLLKVRKKRKGKEGENVDLKTWEQDN